MLSWCPREQALKEYRTIRISKHDRDRLEEMRMASLDYDEELEESVTGRRAYGFYYTTTCHSQRFLVSVTNRMMIEQNSRG